MDGGGIHAAIKPLDGRRVRLRPAEAGDEAAFVAILTDPSVDPRDGTWHDGRLMDLLAAELRD